MDLVPFHATLSPAAAAAAAAAASSSTATAADRSHRSRHRVFHQHEALQLRGHYHDQLQEKPADQPMSIKVQDQTADHHRDHQWPGLPFGFQRGIQVRAGHREQTQVEVHEYDCARTKAQTAVASVHQHGQHRRRQTQ